MARVQDFVNPIVWHLKSSKPNPNGLGWVIGLDGGVWSDDRVSLIYTNINPNL